MGVPHGEHEEPWTLEFHRVVASIYLPIIPELYARALASSFEQCSSLMADGEHPDGIDAGDWMIVAEYADSAARAICEYLRIEQANLNGQALLESTVPGVFPYDGSDATNSGSDATITGFAQPHPPVDQNDTNPDAEIDGDIQGLRPPWSGAVASTYFRDASLGNNPLTSVSGRPSMGTKVCMSAANKVYRRCGQVDDTYTTPDNGDGVGWIRVDFLECCGTQGPIGGDSGGAITYLVGATTAVAVIGNAGPMSGTNAMTYGLRYGYFPLARDIPNQYGGISVFTQSNIWPSYQDSFIAGLYQTALQRQPAVSEVDYWANPIPNGGNCMAPSKWRVEAFLKSAELTNELPLDSLSNATKRVRRLYWSAFNRVPDAGGLNYWADTVLSGGESTWSWLVSYFIYNVTTESNPRFTTVVNQERGPCSS